MKAVYNIIALFRNMLSAGDEDILRCLTYIYDFVSKNPEHCIVYTSCRYLLRTEKRDLLAKIDHKTPTDVAAFRIVSYNTAEIMVDILRPDSSGKLRKSVKRFLLFNSKK